MLAAAPKQSRTECTVHRARNVAHNFSRHQHEPRALQMFHESAFVIKLRPQSSNFSEHGISKVRTRFRDDRERKLLDLGSNPVSSDLI
jgi:hypothetical protein